MFATCLGSVGEAWWDGFEELVGPSWDACGKLLEGNKCVKKTYCSRKKTVGRFRTQIHKSAQGAFWPKLGTMKSERYQDRWT